MKFVFDENWVVALWNTLKSVVGKKQDKLTGEAGQVVGFQNGEPIPQDMKQLLGNVWPDGPYAFEVDDNGCLIVRYNGLAGEPSEQNGRGVPAGGETGQVLAKASGSDYDTQWVTPAAYVTKEELNTAIAAAIAGAIEEAY